MSLNPYPLLWIVGKVDKPESIVSPVTPIEIGDVLDAKPLKRPQENLPQGFVVEPVVNNPTTLVVERISASNLALVEFTAVKFLTI